jgi:hypothetical protein
MDCKIKWQVLPMPDTTGRKWQLKHGDIVLGTIFFKPTTKKYSLWFSTPLVVAKAVSVATITHQYKTLDEAVIRFREMYDAEIIPWAKDVLDMSAMSWEAPDATEDS